MRRAWLVAGVCAFFLSLLVGCSKDEAQNSEATGKARSRLMAPEGVKAKK